MGEFNAGLAAGHHQIDFGKNLGVKQRAMERTLAVVDQVAIAQGIEVITLAREQLARHGQAVGNFAERLGFRQITAEHVELVIHKADVERRVMND
ncbi:hypothetical protein SRABI106_00995 [Rahnella aquatilis]|nr:hypothetical protein SRABI106_00995 [Rahnella aquatilis]